MPQIRDILHADRVLRMMDAGLTYAEASSVDDDSAELLINAWDIAHECDCGCQDDDDDSGQTIILIGHPE